MAAWLAIVYPLIILALMAVATYEHINTTTLSLPLSPVLTFLTVLLPLLAFANALYLPSALFSSSSSSSSSSRSKQPSPFTRAVLPIALQILQLILTTVLATNFASELIPSPIRQCMMESRWKDFWTGHDAESIRRIQDSFNCCGFRTVKDRAWPFPHGKPGDPKVECTTEYHRTIACGAPWEQALQRNAGTEFGVVLTVGVLQVLSLLFMKYINGGNNMPAWVRALFAGRRRQEDTARRHPLLVGAAAAAAEEEEEEDSDEEGGEQEEEEVVGNTRYRDQVDVGQRQQQQRRGTNGGYGGTGTGTGTGPRVEPSPWTVDE
ncbi:hypothetical protein QBC46DRAFT_316121 [Diplogelasinospora grovesii]|uniref:Tetraspanin Tsp3 n=1 Tax=Diplogelasinospora grovesii TaxID=303347 RepID=A0AAN6N6R6_9PEZI|nr:hypothetical protein QBC46DRAFT_316121 [Diplogelasinospora grovesii]